MASSDRVKLLKNLLEQVEAVQSHGRRFAVIFDLDSTLFCVSSRIEAILNELASDPELVANYPTFAPTLQGLRVMPTDWGIRSVLIRAKVLGPLDFFELIRAKWADRFFASEYLKNDVPYPGAVEYVNKLALAGAEIRYLTGRDWPRMGVGTKLSLKHWGFPLLSDAHLHMKPDSNRHDADFKLEILRRLQIETPDICFFENEPVIVNLVHRSLPSLPIIFVRSVHSGRETEPDHLPFIDPDFQSY